jgi:hypothetical protein
MKSQNRISQLTLELYHRGLATHKERKLVKNALKTDSEVLKRYEALQKSDREFRHLISQELNSMNIPERPPFPALRNRKVVFGIIAAAAVLLCVLIPAILYLKGNGPNKGNAIAEETGREIETTEEGLISSEDKPVREIGEIAVPSEPPTVRERGNANPRTPIAETPRPDPGKAAEPELQTENSGVSIATVPEPETGPRLRGGTQPVDPPGNAAVPEEQPNINIPPGITFIFDNMFANRNLNYVIIPSRVTSIGKNAFAGNPLISIYIGADVLMAESAFPGNFSRAYNDNGKAAGTYTRTDVSSDIWTKQ